MASAIVPTTPLEANLLELIDDLATVLQNPGPHGISFHQWEHIYPLQKFRDVTLAKLARISPPIIPSELKERA